MHERHEVNPGEYLVGRPHGMELHMRIEQNAPRIRNARA